MKNKKDYSEGLAFFQELIVCYGLAAVSFAVMFLLGESINPHGIEEIIENPKLKELIYTIANYLKACPEAIRYIGFFLSAAFTCSFAITPVVNASELLRKK